MRLTTPIRLDPPPTAILFRITPALTYVEAQEEDQDAVRTLLTEEDPHKWKSPKFRSGEWDGCHSFFREDPFRLPTGLLPSLLQRLKAHGLEYTLDNASRTKDWGLPPPDLLDGITLWRHQREAIAAALKFERGIIRAPPRSGKTLVAAGITQALSESEDAPSVLFIDSVKLLKQHYEVYSEHFPGKVGRLGSKWKELGQPHTIAMIQPVYQGLKAHRGAIQDWIKSKLVLIVDEVHRAAGAPSWYRSLTACQAPYRIGLSGTPLRDHAGTGDWHAADVWVRGLTGDVIYSISSADLRSKGKLAKTAVWMLPVYDPEVNGEGWHETYREGIVEHVDRNRLAVKAAKSLVRTGRRALIVVQQVRHGKELLQRLDQAGICAAFATGSERVARMRQGHIVWDTYDESVIEELRSRKRPVLVSTGVMEYGVDVPFLEGLINAGGMRSAIPTLQRAFRAMTASRGKSLAVVIDFMDRHSKTLEEHAEERLEHYRSEKLKVRVGIPKGMIERRRKA